MLTSFHVRAVAVALAALCLACGASSVTSIEGASPCSPNDATRVPINDLGTGCYLGFQGGLYPGGSDTLPPAHRDAGIAAAHAIRPLDVNGTPSASGKYVLLSIGMSNTTQEFCSDGGLPGSCTSFSFTGQAAADSTVNHSTLVLVNGAYGGRSAPYWTSPTSSEYDRIRDTWLTPLGLSEKQVQVAWVKVANAQPRTSGRSSSPAGSTPATRRAPSTPSRTPMNPGSPSSGPSSRRSTRWPGAPGTRARATFATTRAPPPGWRGDPTPGPTA